jgi:tripartite-type tricarboxylate transporter receptor subunit TctC
MKRRLCWQVVVLAFLGGLFSGTVASAAGFPEKPVRLIVGFSAGAGIDLEARGIAPYLQKHLGVQVIIENSPGANAKVALTKVWRGKPDGYSVMVHTTTMSIIGQYMLDPEYRIPDYSHIYSWSFTNQVLVVNSEAFKTFDEFIKEGKKRPLSAGLPGIGTASHLSGLILADGLGIKVNWVPFDGSGDALTALAGKHIDFAAVATTSALPLVKAGKLNALVVLANEKDIVFPKVPLAKELGYNFTIIPMIRGADTPPKTPPAVIKKLEEAFAKAVQEPDYLSWAQKRMMEIRPLNGVEYGNAIERQQKEVEKYKNFLKY